jgi:hypothetical protein
MNDKEKPSAWRIAFDERHEFDVYPDDFMSGMRNEFCAGWYAALKANAAPAPSDAAVSDERAHLLIKQPDILERIKGAKQRLESGSGYMRVPPDPTDPDLVLVDAAAEIKRLRAALAQTAPVGEDIRSAFRTWRDRIPNFISLYDESSAWVGFQAGRGERRPSAPAAKAIGFVTVDRYNQKYGVVNDDSLPNNAPLYATPPTSREALTETHKHYAWDLHEHPPLNETAFHAARARMGTNDVVQDRALYQAILVYLATAAQREGEKS